MYNIKFKIGDKVVYQQRLASSPSLYTTILETGHIVSISIEARDNTLWGKAHEITYNISKGFERIESITEGVNQGAIVKKIGEHRTAQAHNQTLMEIKDE